MSKHTPGPFCKGRNIAGQMFIRQHFSDETSTFVAMVNGSTTRDELIDLLNKGTHFDEMLETLVDVAALMDKHGLIPSDIDALGEKVRAAIAKAEATS